MEINIDTVKLVSSIIQKDRDMAEAYLRATDVCKRPDILARLEEFKEHHEAHALRLTQYLLDAGRLVLWDEVDIFRDELDHRMGNDREALTALRQDEELSNRTYENVLARDLPADLRPLVEEGREDERQHLAWIESTLAAMEQQRAA